MNTTELLIANGQLVADTLRHLAENEIDSDYFAITSTSENGTEIDHELVITDYALQAASTVEALVEALESAQRENTDGVAGMVESYETTISMLRSRIAELEARAVTLPDVEKWRSVEAVRAQNAYRVLVINSLAAAGIKCELKGE